MTNYREDGSEMESELTERERTIYYGLADLRIWPRGTTNGQLAWLAKAIVGLCAGSDSARERIVHVLQRWIADRQPSVTVFDLADRIMEALGFDPSAPAGFGDKRAVPGVSR